jgi:hypothetical protein
VVEVGRPVEVLVKVQVVEGVGCTAVVALLYSRVNQRFVECLVKVHVDVAPRLVPEKVRVGVVPGFVEARGRAGCTSISRIVYRCVRGKFNISCLNLTLLLSC